MDNIQCFPLQNPEDPSWAQVKELFDRMYASMLLQGLMLTLTDDGSDKWITMAKNTAGKFSRTMVATSEHQLIGFAHGMIRFLPDYLGGHAIGIVTHIFVDDRYRLTGIGRNLVTGLEEWFLQRNVHSVELQVISGNPGAMEFWENFGFQEELRQYRKLL